MWHAAVTGADWHALFTWVAAMLVTYQYGLLTTDGYPSQY